MYEVETLPEAHASGMKGKNTYEYYAQKCTELELQARPCIMVVKLPPPMRYS